MFWFPYRAPKCSIFLVRAGKTIRFKAKEAWLINRNCTGADEFGQCELSVTVQVASWQQSSKLTAFQTVPCAWSCLTARHNDRSTDKENHNAARPDRPGGKKKSSGARHVRDQRHTFWRCVVSNVALNDRHVSLAEYKGSTFRWCTIRKGSAVSDFCYNDTAHQTSNFCGRTNFEVFRAK